MIGLYVQFVVFAVLVIFFGYKLSKCGQIIAQKRYISEALFGVFFLAIVTSLPEVIASLGSVTVVNAPNMGVSDAVGSILFNLMILAVLDFIQGKGGILSESNRSHILTASLSIIMLSIIMLSIIQRTVTNIDFGIWHIGYESFFLILVYIVLSYVLYKRGAEKPDKGIVKEKVHHLWIKFAIFALIVVISSLSLAKMGKQITVKTGLSEAFVGLVFLAIVTSLPELIISISALRLGSVDMAVGNILGSNFFDTAIIPLCDVFYLKGRILSSISLSHVFTITLCVTLSAIVIVGLLYRSRKSLFKLGFDVIAMIIIFTFSALFFYHIK